MLTDFRYAVFHGAIYEGLVHCTFHNIYTHYFQAPSIDSQSRSSLAYVLQSHISRGLDSNIQLLHKMGLVFFLSPKPVSFFCYIRCILTQVIKKSSQADLNYKGIYYLISSLGMRGNQGCLIQQLSDIVRFPLSPYFVLSSSLAVLRLASIMSAADIPGITSKQCLGEGGLFLSIPLSYD